MGKMRKHLCLLKKQIGYHLLVWPALVFTIIFCYIPMGGLVIAFKDYKLRTGIWDSPWNGLDNFKNLFADYYMPQIILNTVAVGVLSIVVSYPIVIGFALLLNEIRSAAFKRIIQTVSYLPHFISWAIMAVILKALFSATDGVISGLLCDLGITSGPLNILTARDSYWGLVVFSSVWKEMGWSAILYLAVIAGIDETLYEAAKIDGAGRFARMRYITMPQLKGIIAITLIMSVSGIPNTGFDQAYYLSNNVNIESAKTLSYYVYTSGLQKGNFAYATAIGMVLSIVSATLMVAANFISRKLTGKGLY
ncbi:MAG: sugar ABC transporter permease [Roseburia sp.]|nr:sugar ABC transporter permease [Roseburia sp.]